MSRRDLERKLNELTNRLSRLSIEQREIAIELAEVAEQLASRPSSIERTETHRQRETLPEHNKGDRIVITNSNNRHEKRATVTRMEGNRACFRFDSGRFTWRLNHNVRPIREEDVR